MSLYARELAVGAVGINQIVLLKAVEHLIDCVLNHCPSSVLYCSTCTPARRFLTEELGITPHRLEQGIPAVP